MVMRLGREWVDYHMRIVPKDAPPVQVQETRRAFYSGATILLSLIMTGLSPEEDPTEDDLRKMDQLKAEMDQFWKDVEEGRA